MEPKASHPFYSGDMSNNDALMALQQQTYNTLDSKVSDFHQKFQPYMQCKNGCSSCCENAQFRIRIVEAQALWSAYQAASLESQAAIRQNINSPQAGKETDCPMLVNGSCSLYSARPTLCRGYGTLVQLKDEVSTCKLNFNQVPSDVKLDVLDIEPFYDVMDELSNRMWQQSDSSPSSAVPIFTIREFFTGKLQ